MVKWMVLGLAALIAAAAGAWWFDGYRIRSDLLKQPVYRVLQQHEPALFDALLQEYRKYRRDPPSRGHFINVSNAAISEAATRSLAQAAGEPVLALVRDMLSTARTLQGAPDDACFKFWFPKVAGAPDIAARVDADAQARTLGLMGEVIRSAAVDSAPPPDPATVQDDLAAVINATYEEFGADAQMLAHVEDMRVDRTRVCTITIYIYDRILQLPAAQASDLLRVMAGQTGPGPDS